MIYKQNLHIGQCESHVILLLRKFRFKLRLRKEWKEEPVFLSPGLELVPESDRQKGCTEGKLSNHRENQLHDMKFSCVSIVLLLYILHLNNHNLKWKDKKKIKMKIKESTIKQ